jgi:hypothetical protein
MANSNLSSAKKAKNDEFYTKYSDIQQEMEAYIEYDADAFRGKTVYCNCDDPFESNFFRYFVLNFKRLGLKRLITTSYKPSPIANTQLGLFGNDKTIEPPKGRPKVTANKFIINDVHDMDGDGAFNLQDVAEQLKANKNNEWAPLEGDGDFQSNECIKLLKISDIIVTNPPFSLFREYIKQLYEYDKKFVIIANKSTITYQEVFPLIQTNKLWAGTMSFSKDILFIAPANADLSNKPKTAVRVVDGITYLRSPSIWITNLDHGRRHQPLTLMTLADNLKFNKKMQGKGAYERFDNYDAINVPFTSAIPSDYDGIMGVPISFLDKYNPEQFEIIGMSKTPIGTHLRTKEYPRQVQVDKNGKRTNVTKLNDGAAIEVKDVENGKVYYEVGNKKYVAIFPRILLKHRRATA